MGSALRGNSCELPDVSYDFAALLLLLRRGRKFFYVDRDLGRVEERVVNQAVMDDSFDAGSMLVRQLQRRFDLDTEVVDAGDGILDFVGGDADVRAFSRELEFTKILRGIESGARAEGCEQELGRSHAFVEASIFRWLVGCDGVLAGFNFELH